MKALHSFKALCEFLQGSTETPPPTLRNLWSPMWRGIWWGLLAGAILLSLFAIAWTCVPPDGLPVGDTRDNPMWCAVRYRLQQAIDYV